MYKNHNFGDADTIPVPFYSTGTKNVFHLVYSLAFSLWTMVLLLYRCYLNTVHSKFLLCIRVEMAHTAVTNLSKLALKLTFFTKLRSCNY